MQKIVIEIVEEIFFQLRNVQLISEKVKEHVVDEVPENEKLFKQFLNIETFRFEIFILDVVGVHWDDVRIGCEVFKDFD